MLEHITHDNIERFWNRVDVGGDNDCWRWTGSTDGAGYGWFSFGSKDKGKASAHRISLALHLGTELGDACALHSCDNPSCVNPRHLRVGDRGDNARDMVERRRHWSQTGSYSTSGTANGRSKIGPIEVSEIRGRYIAGESQVSIARFYPISRSQVGNIVRGEQWVS
jgi:hypothetical protein